MGELNHDLASTQNSHERERKRDREMCMRMKGSIYSKNGVVNTTRLGVYSTSLMKFVFATDH